MERPTDKVSKKYYIPNCQNNLHNKKFSREIHFPYSDIQTYILNFTAAFLPRDSFFWGGGELGLFGGKLVGLVCGFEVLEAYFFLGGRGVIFRKKT